MQKKTMKEIYETPQTRVFEVKTEGVVCASPVDVNREDYGNYNEW